MFSIVSLGALFQTLFLLTRAFTLNATARQHAPHYRPGCVDPTSEYDVPSSLQQILSSNESKWSYPTDFTGDIIPKTLHSHNDYWRDVPYYSAISVGAISVEADVWLVNDTLFVGHELSALTPERTLQSLYLDPIMDTLKRQNPSSVFVSGTTHNGVFDTSSAQTLYLWFDCKTDGETTFAAAIAALQPLREAGLLTTYSPSTGVTHGVVTVTGTGNTPISYFTDPSQERWYFFDAELPDLVPGGAQADVVNSNISLIASTDFMATVGVVGKNRSGLLRLFGPAGRLAGKAAGLLGFMTRCWLWQTEIFSPAQLNLVRSQIAAAQAKGIGARYWDTPGWPSRVRNAVWRTLYEEGVALINVDDLEAAAFFEW